MIEAMLFFIYVALVFGLISINSNLREIRDAITEQKS